MFIQVSLLFLKKCDCGLCPPHDVWAVKISAGDEVDLIGPFKTRDEANQYAERLSARVEETLQRSGKTYIRGDAGTFPSEGGDA